MEMLDWLSKFRDKNQQEAGIIFMGRIQKPIQQLIFEVYYQQAFDHLSKKKFPLYAWVSAKTLNFEYTYPQHFEWNSLSKRLRENAAFWNLKQMLLQFDLMDVSV